MAMQNRFDNEIVYNRIHLTSSKSQILDNDELMIGLSVALVGLFTLWIMFKRLQSSLFSQSSFEDYFESQQRFADRYTDQDVSQYQEQMISDYKDQVLHLNINNRNQTIQLANKAHSDNLVIRDSVFME